MPLYGESDYIREIKGAGTGFSKSEPYRSDFRRDYARLIHCASFRRLVGKTQLFPAIESDFFRNRLTHSLEVAPDCEVDRAEAEPRAEVPAAARAHRRRPDRSRRPGTRSGPSPIRPQRRARARQVHAPTRRIRRKCANASDSGAAGKANDKR